MHNALRGAVDLGTGTPLPFSASLGGTGAGDVVEVTDVAVQGDSVFAAGACDDRGCPPVVGICPGSTPGRARVRALEMRWRACRGRYNAVAVHGRRLYVGGGFRTIGGRRAGEPRRSSTSAAGRVTRWRVDANIGRWASTWRSTATRSTSAEFHARGRPAPARPRRGRPAHRTAHELEPEREEHRRVDALAVTAGRVYLGGDSGARPGTAVRSRGRPGRRSRRALEPPDQQICGARSP